MNGFTTNNQLLNESYQVEDLFGYDVYAKRLFKEIVNSPNNSIFGVVGPYGIGKSVMLEQAKKLIDENDRWIHIDAWKYPDRRDLWEGFILDFASQLGEKVLTKLKLKLDGDRGAKSTALKTGGTIAKFIPIPGISLAVDGITNGLDYFISSSPAKRIYEVQQLLINLLDEVKDKNIYITIEDADRSGQAGLYFIETLNLYLKNLGHSTSVKVIVPISDKEFTNHEQSYIKCLDEVRFFSVNNLAVNKFIETVFSDKICTSKNYFSHLDSIISHLLRMFTIRKLKMLLRVSNTRYKYLISRGFQADPRLVILFTASEYQPNEFGSSGTLLEQYINNKQLGPRGFDANLLVAVTNDLTYEQASNDNGALEISDYHRRFHFKHTDVKSEDSNTCIPYQKPNDQEGAAQFVISENYLFI